MEVRERWFEDVGEFDWVGMEERKVEKWMGGDRESGEMDVGDRGLIGLSQWVSFCVGCLLV